MFPDTYWYGHFFFFPYVELASEARPHLSVTPRAYNSFKLILYAQKGKQGLQNQK
jgi:hypothetical protein